MPIKNPAAAAALGKGDIANFLVANTPGGIEAQEAAGQQKLVSKDMLPVECNVSRDKLEAIGFVFGPPIDDLFVECTLPPGWKKSASTHSMWSDIVDEQGRVRAGIFYKAAFYDRRADVRFNCLYSVYGYEDKTIDDRDPVVVKRGNAIVKEIGSYRRQDYKARAELEEQARAYLDKHFPDWQNPLAYW